MTVYWAAPGESNIHFDKQLTIHNSVQTMKYMYQPYSKIT